MTFEQLQKYFKRLNIEPVTSPTLQTLSLLQQNHSFSIPFENLNPLLGMPVSLDSNAFFSKMVVQKRGGYCYEQNVLFLNVLKALGFNSRGLTGRVMEKNRGFIRRTHMLILTEIDDKFYISDVGFGSDAPCVPLLLETDTEQKTPAGNYILTKDEKWGFILKDFFNSKWRILYCFDLQKQLHEDFEVGNWYTSTHPSSHFTKDLLVSVKGDNCRYTLHKNILYTYLPERETKKQVLKTSGEIRKVLTNIFKINLSELPGLDKKLQEQIV